MHGINEVIDQIHFRKNFQTILILCIAAYLSLAGSIVLIECSISLVIYTVSYLFRISTCILQQCKPELSINRTKNLEFQGKNGNTDKHNATYGTTVKCSFVLFVVCFTVTIIYAVQIPSSNWRTTNAINLTESIEWWSAARNAWIEAQNFIAFEMVLDLVTCRTTNSISLWNQTIFKPVRISGSAPNAKAKNPFSFSQNAKQRKIRPYLRF